MITKPFAYLSAALFVVIIVLTVFTYSYRSELQELTLKYAVSISNATTCKASLQEQNRLIEALRLKKEEPKFITKIEYKDRLSIKYIDRNITKEECNEVINTIDAVRSRYP